MAVIMPLRWSLHHPPPYLPEQPPTGAPLYYTAPGGWLIINDPVDDAPDRPWKLCRHGVEIERCHTLRIAKSTADRMTAASERTPA